MRVIKKAWRYGRLESYEFDDIDEAVASALWQADAGNEALESFEITHDSGGTEVVEHEAAMQMIADYERRMSSP